MSVEELNCVLATVTGEVAVVAVDHRQARAHVAGEFEGGDAGTESEGREGASLRAVPLQARALEALDQLPASDSPLLFPGERGNYLDIHHFRPYQWRPAQEAAGLDPPRRIYDLRRSALVPGWSDRMV